MTKKKLLTKEEIVHLAKLANLHLSEKEIEKFRRQLSDVVDYINKLNQVETKDVEPVAQLTELENVTIPDEVLDERRLTQEEAIKNAKSKKDGYIKVKAIFDRII